MSDKLLTVLLILLSIASLAKAQARGRITLRQEPVASAGDSRIAEELFPPMLAGLRRSKVEFTGSGTGYVAAAEYTDGLRLELRKGGAMASPQQLRALAEHYKNRPTREGDVGYERPVLIQGYQSLEIYVSYSGLRLCNIILGDVGQLSINSRLTEDIFRKAISELDLKGLEKKLKAKP
ncbi:MAG: hypothetical protein RMM17_00640 [Acidobacteriota bacterium]|nr:hypothetical protein [Blastocatellia bacterium]MDW8411174.1 hypothetical protein [Acidobacteriota bacterium]